MKFKKVEIQAFRAYDKVKDGTFDFTGKDGKNVDFISIYAPNGFGKTSFYDAVEYGIKNNIDRFLRKGNGKDTFNSVKSERSIRSNKRQYFLRNNNSDDNLPAFIKLYTVDDEKPIETKIEKPKTKAGYDYKFDPSLTINKEFKTVILSQEWIDAFLKEDKPEDRYERFIEYFGDKKIDEYYKKLINLIELNNKRIEALKKELIGIQLELKFDGDRNILQKVNEKIILLNKYGEHLKEIDEYFSERDALNFTNKISERTSDLNYEIKKKGERIKYLEVFFTGNDQIEGLDKYFESKNQIEQIDKQRKLNYSIIENFSIRQKLINEIDAIRNQNTELVTKKQILESLKNDFNEYERITKEISVKAIESDEIKKELSNLTKNLNTLKQTEKENSNKQSSLQKQILELETKVLEIPKLSEDIATTNLKLAEFQKQLDEIEVNIKSSEKDKKILEIPIRDLKTSLQQIEQGLYPSEADEAYSKNAQIIIALTDLGKLTAKEQNNLNEIYSKLQASENFQKEVQQFISQGSEIVNKSQTSSCPLCEQTYESFGVLAAKISNNSLLSDVLSSLMNERDEKNNIINQLKESTKHRSAELVDNITKQLEEKENQLKKIVSELKTQNKSKSKIINEIELLTKAFNELFLKINGKAIDIFQKESESSLSKLRTDLNLCVKNGEEIKNSLLNISLTSQNIKDRHSKISSELTKLGVESAYLRIVDYFNTNHPATIVDEKIISEEISLLANNLKSNEDRELELKKKIEDVNIVLNVYKIEAVQEQNELLEKVKSLYVKIVNSFEQEVKSKLTVDIKDYTIEAFSQLLENTKRIATEEINKSEVMIKEYNLLIQLKDNVTPYLQYERAKSKEKNTRERIEFLRTKIYGVLNTELERVADFLKQQIESFFYEGLINDLYRKIDPHPDYKTVTFKCDFAEPRPKLNVCVYHEKQDELIIPNLYFSTAQLNILSLSIFLAKALNAKDERGKPIDCIFIDDPIQSMDSINILSTIDLIRSIVVNHKKQIVLSTHDENFHNLLKKKIPSNLFNSKFMELETFGKVKPDSL